MSNQDVRMALYRQKEKAMQKCGLGRSGLEVSASLSAHFQSTEDFQQSILGHRPRVRRSKVTR